MQTQPIISLLITFRYCEIILSAYRVPDDPEVQGVHEGSLYGARSRLSNRLALHRSKVLRLRLAAILNYSYSYRLRIVSSITDKPFVLEKHRIMIEHPRWIKASRDPTFKALDINEVKNWLQRVYRIPGTGRSLSYHLSVFSYIFYALTRFGSFLSS